MKIVVLPYGNAGWKKKRGILEDALALRTETPFLYNDVLTIVPSKRLKRLYGRLFLEFAERHGSAALVQPDMQTLDDFFRKLYARTAGPLPLGENSRLVLLEGIVKGLLNTSSPFSLSPDLLAPSLSSALADMIEQLAGAGVGPEELAVKLRGTDFSDKPQVNLLVDVYAAYDKALLKSNLTDPAGMRAHLRDGFDPSWLSSYRSIIIEGIEDVSAVEGDILRMIAGCCDCTYVVDAPSAEILDHAGEFHPVRIIRNTLSRIGALSSMAGHAQDLEPGFVASALFSDKPFSEIAEKAPAPQSFAKTIDLISAVNTREELTFIAGRVKQSIKRGIPPDSILVTFPAFDSYGPLVEEIFSDCGIPFNRALGRQLSTSPVTTAVISLLLACQEDFSGPSLLRIFSSPFLRFGGNRVTVSALDHLMRDRHITGGRMKLLSALNAYRPAERGTNMLTGPLNELFTALEPFTVQEPLSLAVWMDRLGHLIAWSGLSTGVAAIEGPLSVNRQAYRKLQETLESLAHAGDLFPEFRYTFREWLFLLKKTFMHTRFQVPPEDEGGVQILGLRESYGHPWQEIYFGGLVDSEFPQRLPQNIFLPEQTLEALGVHTFEHERLKAALHFYRLLLMADTITLTYPENEGDRPVVPSPFLEELTSLKRAGLLNRGIEKTSGIQFSMKIEDACSIPGLAKSISQRENFRGLQEVLNMNIKGMTAIRSGVNYLPREHATIVTPSGKREFRVTELELYINCPYDYYVSCVLGMVPLEEVTEDISPMDRGSKVHMILRDFYLSWGKAVTRESRDKARALLRNLADASFDREADTFRNRREKEIFLSVMAERFLDAEVEFWKQGMRPVYLERSIERYRLALPDGKEVELKAKIDRIDVDENGNFIIVDYKTGRYPLPKMNTDQDIFQLPVYAVMAKHALADALPALRTPVGLAYYDLVGKAGAGARDVVLYNNDVLADQPSSRPKASSRSASEFEAILKQGMDKARRAVEGIIRGDFTSLPRDENRCRYCPNEMMCENER